MKSVWITYAWNDNDDHQVDFVSQELEEVGLTVKLDRWNLRAGEWLWDQIEHFVQDPNECDAWLLFATQNSQGSKPCREEYFYALDRALSARGDAFPIIALFPGEVERSLIPAGIRTRLYVTLTDSDWKERVKAAAEGRAPNIDRPRIEAFHCHIHPWPNAAHPHIIEVGPRAGTWGPFIACIPIEEKERVNPRLSHGPRGSVPTSAAMTACGSGESHDGTSWCVWASNQATPTFSYYVFCSALPSKLQFGNKGAPPQYEIGFRT